MFPSCVHQCTSCITNEKQPKRHQTKNGLRDVRPKIARYLSLNLMEKMQETLDKNDMKDTRQKRHIRMKNDILQYKKLLKKT